MAKKATKKRTRKPAVKVVVPPEVQILTDEVRKLRLLSDQRTVAHTRSELRVLDDLIATVGQVADIATNLIQATYTLDEVQRHVKVVSDLRRSIDSLTRELSHKDGEIQLLKNRLYDLGDDED